MVNVPEGGSPGPDSALILATETWLRVALSCLTEGPWASGKDGSCKGKFVLFLTTEGLGKCQKPCSGTGSWVRPHYEAPWQLKDFLGHWGLNINRSGL